MPGAVHAFASVNPVSLAANAVRGLMVGGPVAGSVLGTLACLMLVFVPFAVPVTGRCSNSMRALATSGLALGVFGPSLLCSAPSRYARSAARPRHRRRRIVPEPE